MNRRKRIRLFQLLLGALLYLLSFHAAELAEESLEVTQIVLDSGISAEKAGQLQDQEQAEEEPVGFCFWGETTQQTVSCRGTGKSAQVNQILLAGNPELFRKIAVYMSYNFHLSFSVLRCSFLLFLSRQYTTCPSFRQLRFARFRTFPCIFVL